MTPVAAPKDLIVLAADSSIEAAMTALLGRYQALGIAMISHAVILQPNYDSGVLRSGAATLQAQRRNYLHALTICDRHGCGKESAPREHLESRIEKQLAVHWEDRATAIVIDPELENWFWTDSAHVAETVGWKKGMGDLRQWLGREGFLTPGKTKPTDPKAALQKALRLTRKPKSSSLYGSLASKASFKHCTDPAFLKFKATLQSWFPVESP
jgi:hypothetical protein